MRSVYILLALILCLSLTACGESAGNVGSPDTNVSGSAPSEVNQQQETLNPEYAATEEPVEETQPQDESPANKEVGLLYYESDEIIDKFFTDYNDVAELSIPANAIEAGNMGSKANVYIDDLSLEITNAGDYLAISMGCATENETTKLYVVYRDVILAMKSDVPVEEIQRSWNEIHESGYLVEDYDFEGISITYVPARELSTGTTSLRIDLEIPLNE